MIKVMETCSVPIKKLSENYYEFGTRRVYIKHDIDDDSLTVRDRGGNYIHLDDFMRRYENEELQKLN